MNTITRHATLKDMPKFLAGIQNAIEDTELNMNIAADFETTDTYDGLKKIRDSLRETEIVLQWAVDNTDMIELVKQVLPNLEF